MTFDVRRTIRLALVAGAAISIAACASHPKPAPEPPPAPPPAPAPAPPPPPPPAPVAQAPVGPAPGSIQDFVVNAGDRVYFDLDQYNIRADAEPVLTAQAGWLTKYPQVKVRIEGNCDERGTREYNFALGGRRANAVRDFLVAHGVAASRIETVSYGKERPVDPGTGEDAWAHNRNGHTAITAGAQ
ncbi:peptidoglycan-associated lipoprotein Pal [Phenylobacterium montanum]|uniref:Peptidoglycan-associated lipoprotein n=1 Tax=Phenylobacterium montanum TaxID=2823693 RepID=A0A975ITW1_9CAUL|nr:peptidoglycan-associated lipoprotein Pal [Caulobacter sp. S6]QUD87135.1 peptidoglycan-associated lipoprotein Pal [Caulobacter sp. S6]